MKDPNLMIDRMVDGELGATEEIEVLQQCESNNRWRELALAFVESQTLRRELRGLLEEGATGNRDDIAPSPGTQTSLVRNQGLRFFALAAAVLLSLGLGYAAGWDRQRSTTFRDLAEHPQRHPPGHSESDRPLPRSMQFLVNQPNSQEMHQVEIPILDAKDLGPDWQQRLQTNSWDELVQEMRRQGLNLRQQRTLTPVRLSNGQRVVVPVDYFFEQPYQ